MKKHLCHAHADLDEPDWFPAVGEAACEAPFSPHQAPVWDEDVPGLDGTDNGPSAAEAGGDPDFAPSLAFDGARPGWIFTSGPSGVGYYRDAPLPADESLPIFRTLWG